MIPDPIATLTSQPAFLPTAYPGDIIIEPTSPYPSDSVVEPRATPTIMLAYPASELTWIIKPAGMQCQSYTTDLGSARTEIENAGITVLNSELAILPVCEACDVCASSEHYRLYIPITDLEQAQELGWVVDEN